MLDRPLRRMPRATELLTSEGWEIDFDLEDADWALPADVAATRRRDAAQGEADVLDVTTSQLVDDLLSIGAQAATDDAGAALRLRDHVRRYGAPDLCRHGLPRGHSWRKGTRLPRDAWEKRLGECHRGPVMLSHVAGFTVAARACLEAYTDPAWPDVLQRDAGRDRLGELLSLPILEPAFERLVRAEYEREDDAVDPDNGWRELSGSRSHQVADLWISELMRAGGVRVGIATRPGLGPGLALLAGTVMGLYSIELARRVGADVEPSSHACPGCGRAVIGRPGKVWCGEPACRREHARRRKAATRAQPRAAEAGQ